MKTTQTKAEIQMRAGRDCAVADFNRGKFLPPVKGDCRSWAAGYRLAIQDLAQTFGKDAVRRAGADWGTEV